MAKENKEQVIRQFLQDIYTDPTLLSFDFGVNTHSLLFCLDEHIDSASLDFWDESSLLNSLKVKAENIMATPLILLNNLGENVRAKLFKRFVKGFCSVLSGQQWRVQSIEGLDGIFTSAINFKDGYKGSGDEKISITFIEDVELTMYNLFELYRESIYDNVYKRQLIPNNLLKFDCFIAISDKRNLIYHTHGSVTNSRNENKQNSNDNNKKDNRKLAEKVNDYTKDTRSTLGQLKSPVQDYKTTFGEYVNKAYDKPIILIKLCDCMFDLSSIAKSFENVNPGDGDNNAAKYTISFKYGNVYMTSSTVEEMKEWDADEEREKQGGEGNFSKLSFEIFSAGNNATLSGLAAGGVDGAIDSAKEFGQNYLDNLKNKGVNELQNLVSSVAGVEQGYEVGQNVYGQSNFITAFGEKVGDRLSQFGEETLNKVKSNTLGKVNEFINTQKAKVQGAINNAESSVMGGNKKSKSITENPLQSPQQVETTNNNPQVSRLTGNERVYTGNNTKNSETFESFNIYENTPSGPKQ